MLRWYLFAAALVVVAFSFLTVVKSPDWSQWRFAVLAGEYGHWFALGALALVGLAGNFSRPPTVPVVAAMMLGLVAVILFLKPSFEAWRVAQTLPAALERAFGRVEIGRRPYSPAALFGFAPQPVSVETLSFSGELALDFYRAVRTDGASAPCVIVVHGGGWDSGDRAQIAHFNDWLARRGYAVAAISYRLAPKSIWPAQRDDLLAAIAAVKAQAGRLGVDPARLVLLGRSAGGQIVEAVGYAVHDPAIRGLVGLYAPSDLHFGYAHAREDDAIKSPTLMRRYLGGPPAAARAAYDSASALQHVTAAAPPTLLLHGENDTLVWHRHSERLDGKLAEKGVPRAFVSLPWATHAFDYNLNGPGGQITTYALEWFLAAVTRK